jgi:transcriptional regulator with XRE-family HTH domain
MDYGQRLRNARLASEMSQQELATRIGVSKQHICDIELGRRMPSDAVAQRIEATLQVKPPVDRLTELEQRVAALEAENDSRRQLNNILIDKVSNFGDEIVRLRAACRMALESLEQESREQSAIGLPVRLYPHTQAALRAALANTSGEVCEMCGSDPMTHNHSRYGKVCDSCYTAQADAGREGQ